MRDAVVIDAVRSAVGRRGGSLAGIHPVDLLASVLDQLVRQSQVDPASVDDHICGCVSQVGEQSLNVGRNAWLAAALPEQVPSVSVDRQCGSSQQAVAFSAQGIQADAYDVAIASGVEHMSRVAMYSSTAGKDPFGPALTAAYEGRLVHQGISAELIAHRWGISRSQQDELALRSHERAATALAKGHFRSEVVPIHIDGSAFAVDECVRVDTSLDRMAALDPAFRDESYEQLFPEQLGWTVTAANASQISDGAAAVLLMSDEQARRSGARPLARVVASVAVAGDPVLMLTAPAPATRKVLAAAGLKLDDIDLVEINEAFASVVLAWQRELDISDAWFDARVNTSGGAIALGHPLGASGAKLLTTLVHALARTGGRFGLQVMCEAGGQANATIIERLR